MVYWRGQKASISAEDNDSGSSITLGALTDIEVNLSKETAELYGSGSTKRLDVQQTEQQVMISGTLIGWDMDAFKSLIGYDSANDQIKDTSTVPTFTVTAQVEDTSGNTYDIEATDAYTEEVPISGGRDEWLSMELEFIASDLSVTSV